jgi:hypothetical protein
MSPEGRLRIQEAVRRRWERVRAEQAGPDQHREVRGGAVTSAPEDVTPAVEVPSVVRRARRPNRAGGRKK